MKTYLSVGIGDMVFLDSILTLEEKATISEIYWACRFGKCLIPLIENNPDYPNLVAQHTIPDEVGQQAMASLDPIAIPFWHFRPDFQVCRSSTLYGCINIRFIRIANFRKHLFGCRIYRIKALTFFWLNKFSTNKQSIITCNICNSTRLRCVGILKIAHDAPNPLLRSWH